MYWLGYAKTAMSPEAQLQLLREYKKANGEIKTALRNKIISTNFGLILNIASKYDKANQMGSEDIFQEGVLGMYKAIDKYNPDMGAAFCTYATYWVRLFIIEFIKKNSKLVRVTEYANNQLGELKKNSDDKKLQDKWGYYRYQEIKNLSEKKDSDVSLFRDMKDESDFLGDIKIENFKSILNKILKTFSVREKVIIRCRFALNNGKRKKLEEIGKPFGITKEGIRQIERKAMRKLKKRLINLGISSSGATLND